MVDLAHWTQRDMRDFIEAYAPMMRVFVSRWGVDADEVDDILQEGYLKLWTARTRVGEVENIRTYFMGILRNCLIDGWVSRRGVVPLTPEYFEIASNETFVSNIIAAESSRLILEAINALSPQARQVMLLTLEGKKMEEIAQLLNISLNSVKTVKYRAIERLSHILSREDFLLGLLLLLR